MIRKILAFSLAAVTCLSLMACSNSGTKTGSKKITIGVTMTNLSEAYFKPVANYCQSEAKKLGVTAEIEDAQGNSQEQANQINTFIAQKVSAVILCPVDQSSNLPSLKMLKAANIPCVVVNAKLDDVSSTYEASFVGSSSEAEGQMAADMTDQALGANGGNVVIIEGVLGTEPQYYRTQSYEQEISTKYKNIKILSVADGNWDRATAMSAAEDMLTKYSNISAIFAEDDNMCIGAINAAKAAGRASSIKFIGIGGSIDGLAAIKAGEMYGSVSQPPDFEGATSMDVAVNVVKGNRVEAWYMDPVKAITASNVSQFKGLW